MERTKGTEKWADSILIGPGIGMGEHAHELLRFCIEESSLPLVIDADGLNLLAEDAMLLKMLADREEKELAIDFIVLLSAKMRVVWRYVRGCMRSI